MKKTRLLALTSLCSVLAGIPTNAQEIKDSGAKKIGGVGTQVSKESPNGKNKNEFENRFYAEYIKKLLKDPYVEWVLGVLTIGGTHEGLSYFKGKSGQFYEKPAGFSLTGYSRKRKELKLAEEEKLKKEKLAAEKLKQEEALKLKKKLMEEERKKHEDKMKQLLQKRKDLENDKELKPIFQKIKESDFNILWKYGIYISDCVDSTKKESKSKIVANQVVGGQALEELKKALKEKSKVTEEEFKKISNRVNFHIYYFNYKSKKNDEIKKKKGFILTCFPKDCNTDEVYNVQGDEEVRKFQQNFRLFPAVSIY